MKNLWFAFLVWYCKPNECHRYKSMRNYFQNRKQVCFQKYICTNNPGKAAALLKDTKVYLYIKSPFKMISSQNKIE